MGLKTPAEPLPTGSIFEIGTTKVISRSRLHVASFAAFSSSAALIADAATVATDNLALTPMSVRITVISADLAGFDKEQPCY